MYYGRFVTKGIGYMQEKTFPQPFLLAVTNPRSHASKGIVRHWHRDKGLAMLVTLREL